MSTAATEEHMATHEAKKDFYTVKITDSYNKIAHAPGDDRLSLCRCALWHARLNARELRE